MMKYFSLIVLIAFCMACKKQKARTELNYSNDVIRNVVSDMYIAAEALKDIEAIKQDSLRRLYSSQIERIHKVEIEKIEADMQVLMRDPKRYKEIHQAAKDSLVSWSNRLN